MWRPRQLIRVLAIAIAERDGRVLVFEVLDDDGSIAGWRPLGGGVEFMESASDALQREVREELRCDVEIVGQPLVLENLYSHRGAPGHEIVFAFPARFLDDTIYARDRLAFNEHDGGCQWAEWISLDRFVRGEATLYPEGLLQHLVSS